MRYFVECTHTCGTDLNTGIQRVVRNIVNESFGLDTRDIVPVAYENGQLHAVTQKLLAPLNVAAAKPALRQRVRQTIGGFKRYLLTVYFTGRQFLAALVPWRPFARFVMAPRDQWGLTTLLTLPFRLFWRRAAVVPATPQPGLSIGAGDVLVLLDASWHLDIWPLVLAAKERGATIVCVIYDLIPYTHPDFCDQYHVANFHRWMAVAMREVDIYLCISRTVAEHLRTVIPQIAPDRKTPFRTGHFWLGSELDGHHATASALATSIRHVIESRAPLYLYVSTIEPRKNHAYTLSAFEQLWQTGTRVTLAIVGRVGWRCDALIERIRTHPQFGKQLFLLNDVDDNALAALYDRANGLVFTSMVEGFGLPLVEALQRGLPVFASDIPVFREISREGVAFVDLSDPKSLRQALERHLQAGAQRLRAPVPWLTWHEATRQFWDRLDECLENPMTSMAAKAQSLA